MLRNSAAETFYGGFTASKIRWLIRRAVIFPVDFRRTKFGGEFGDRRRLRGLLQAEWIPMLLMLFLTVCKATIVYMTLIGCVKPPFGIPPHEISGFLAA